MYFEEIRRELRLPHTQIRVCHCATGTTPLQVVSYAEHLLLTEKSFDSVYCVFDRDEHQGYDNALQKATALDRKHKNDERVPVRFFAVPSVPSFELWLLIHFETVTAHIERDKAFHALRRYLPRYEKGLPGTFAATRANLPQAYTQAETLRTICERNATTNPRTDVDLLVKVLLTQR